MKRFILLIMFLVPLQAGTVGLGSDQEPVSVRLSDGRPVPFGPGVFCSDTCIEIEDTKKPLWLLLPGGALIALALLPKIQPVRLPGPDKTSEVTPVLPASQMPEPGSLVLLGTGLFILGRSLRKDRTCSN